MSQKPVGLAGISVLITASTLPPLRVCHKSLSAWQAFLSQISLIANGDEYKSQKPVGLAGISVQFQQGK